MNFASSRIAPDALIASPDASWLLSAPAGVVDVARVLHMSQPTVSAHLEVLRDEGLVQPRRAAGRTVLVGSRKRIERLLEDARATIARRD